MGINIVNHKGEQLPDDYIRKVRKNEYQLKDTLTDTPIFNEHGEAEINWKCLLHSDACGFDTRNVFENGLCYREVELPKGTRLVRYGNPMGSFTAPIGTLYEHLSLPWEIDTIEYHEYEVMVDGLKVKEGIVAPGFDYPGGGIQYVHDTHLFKQLLENKIKEIGK